MAYLKFSMVIYIGAMIANLVCKHNNSWPKSELRYICHAHQLNLSSSANIICHKKMFDLP